jgi:hypothetical protein
MENLRLLSKLYALAYAIKMGYKADAVIGGNEVHDFSVYPLERKESSHREIYLNNAGRVEMNKLKTILRYSVK